MESQALGLIIRGGVSDPAVFDRLRDEHFSDPKNRAIWRATASAWARFGKVTMAGVIAESRKLSDRPEVLQDRIREIHHAAPDAGMIDAYLDALDDWAERRHAMRAVYNAAHGLLDYGVPVGATSARLASEIEDMAHSARSVDDLADRPAVLDRVIESILTPKPWDMIPTGYVDLDRVVGGLKGGELVVIAGRPASGKSALAGSIADNVASAGVPVLYFSLEMNARKAWIRQLSWRARIDAARLSRSAELSQADRERLAAARESILGTGLYFECRAGRTIAQMRTRLRYAMESLGVRVAIVDQANWVPTDPKLDERARLSTVTRAFKMIAEEFDVPVVLLHQLNREAENPGANYRPELRHLKGSGSFEEDADMVLLCYRPEVYGVGFLDENGNEEPSEGLGEILVEKNRDGLPMAVRMAFLGRFTRWEDLAIGMELNRGVGELHGVEW